MTTEWRAPASADIRSLLRDSAITTPHWEEAELRQLGYELPGWQERQAQAAADARDARLLRAV
jgi:hypothetical protein